MTDDKEMLARWRLILGQFAEDTLPLDNVYSETDDALSFLYGREYTSERGSEHTGKQGGRGHSVLTVPAWIAKVRKLFPKNTSDIMQKQALDRYGIQELITDPQVLEQLRPDIGLLNKLLSFRSIIPETVRAQADNIIRKIAEEIQKRLETELRRSFTGKRTSSSASAPRIYKNLDFPRTVKSGLKNYSPEYGTIIPERIYFRGNVRRYNPWDIIILVDQSGSMADSVIYSAITAAIFAKLPFMSVRLAVFDTAVADLSEHIDNAAELLMKVQLGGGTDIYKALCYGESLMTKPAKTIFLLITDLYDGGNIRRIYGKTAALIEGGSKVFVIPALDYSCDPSYNRTAAKVLASLGAEVGAVTPEGLAEWIGNMIL